jgi:HTH-type transcriptional regulator, transcriptional repressor of NAD biosynthesis genes
VRPGSAPVVCLQGGESSGKTTLAFELHRWLSENHQLRVALVSEHLRAWCETHHRAPLAHEQTGIAAIQSHMIEAARTSAGVQLVLSDTSALTVAAYSELYFNDRSLWSDALQSHRNVDATLMMGLDLPWVPDGLFRDGAAIRDKTDALLRHGLQAAGIAFHTVYGSGERRLHNALRALSPLLKPLLGHAPIATTDLTVSGRPGWVCEGCSDPECEQRLFTSLLKPTP